MVHPKMMADVLAEASAKLDPSGHGGYDGFWDNAQAFFHAVAWKDEPWLQMLLAFHVALWLLAFLSRRWMSAQAGIFLFCCAVVRLAEAFNTVAERRWREFATQNYFDKRGVFTGVVLCVPLLFLLLLVVLNTIWQASNTLVVQKRAELRGILPPGSVAAKAAAAKNNKKKQ